MVMMMMMMEVNGMVAAWSASAGSEPHAAS